MRKHDLCVLLTVSCLSACSDEVPSAADQGIFVDAGDVGATTPPAPCEPGQTMCWEGQVATCQADGLGWLLDSCGTDEVCEDGTCVQTSCAPGERLCAPDRVLICRDDGLSWDVEQCAEGWACFEGECIECLTETDCESEQTCEDGLCVPLPLTVITEELPDTIVGDVYEASLEAAGGLTPYTWSVLEGELPNGIELSDLGLLSGSADVAGEYDVTIGVTDAELSEAESLFTLVVHSEGLVVSTDSLPTAEEGIEYEAQLEALGGSLPYAWMAASGTLPAGVSLTADGLLFGVPSEIGDFIIGFRVFDSALPPAYADRELVLSVEIAPLEIVGDQSYDLFVTKVIVLPLITVVEGIPIPYSTQLQARGGLRPYHWTEVEIPATVEAFVPNAGIPDGLVLDEDGTLHGAVTSTEQVSSLEIPFTGIVLNGFFFMAQVADSQSTAETKSALFLIPTLPIGG